MNETKRNERESYETPVVQDIKPVTVTCGQGDSPLEQLDNNPNPDIS